MVDLQRVFKQLKQERRRAQKELQRLEYAIAVFGKLSGVGRRAAKPQRTTFCCHPKEDSRGSASALGKAQGKVGKLPAGCGGRRDLRDQKVLSWPWRFFELREYP